MSREEKIFFSLCLLRERVGRFINKWRKSQDWLLQLYKLKTYFIISVSRFMYIHVTYSVYNLNIIYTQSRLILGKVLTKLIFA